MNNCWHDSIDLRKWFTFSFDSNLSIWRNKFRWRRGFTRIMRQNHKAKSANYFGLRVLLQSYRSPGRPGSNGADPAPNSAAMEQGGANDQTYSVPKNSAKIRVTLCSLFSRHTTTSGEKFSARNCNFIHWNNIDSLKTNNLKCLL